MSASMSFLDLSKAEQRDWLKKRWKAKTLTSELVIRAMRPMPIRLTSEEVQHDEDATTADDYDDWVWQAWLDYSSKPPRFHPSSADPATIECPKGRLLRIGKDSLDAGKPSEFYLFLMKKTQEGAMLPNIRDPRLMRRAQKRLNIAHAFAGFIAQQKPDTNFREAKKEFRRDIERKKYPCIPTTISLKGINAALNENGLGWSAYSIDTRRRRKQ
jgi:hypothetical protein